MLSGTGTLAKSLKKTDTSLPMSYKLPIVPQVGVELFKSLFPIDDGVLAGSTFGISWGLAAMTTVSSCV